MNRRNTLEVCFDGKTVGTLAIAETGTEKGKVLFEYNEDWLKNGFSISPFSLPLQPGVFVPKNWNFGGLFGVFGDALPDSWGKFLVDRMLQKQGIDPSSLTVLDRLGIVGDSGMGALTFHPEYSIKPQLSDLTFDELASLCARILKSQEVEDFDSVFAMGGSSGGTRPKVLSVFEGEEWIVKFRAHTDPADFGKLEYDYAECAVKCGIYMAEHKLFPSEKCKGYFGTKRFDRPRPMHMLSAAALLELDFNAPSLDYHELMKLTRILTHDNKEDLKDLFRRMCFNIYAHNMDDHTKNFAYLYDENQNLWHLSPAFDLTYSTTYFGEHTTSVNGNGVAPTQDDLLAVGTKAGLSKQWCLKTISDIETIVKTDLKQYLK